MSKFFYDFHIHSCLSPCADNDMTPGNIAGMAALNGLNIIALTDHNSCGNCKAFFNACMDNGIIPLAGMELTSAEEVHLVILFKTLEEAFAFEKEVKNNIIPIKNREDIFGEQLYIDENDEIIGKEENLLIVATNFDIETAAAKAREYGGIVYPAHIDRNANGIISILGDIPPEACFKSAEIHDKTKTESLISKYKNLELMQIVTSSDAHHLWEINEAENFFEIDEACNINTIKDKLFELLSGNNKDLGFDEGKT